MRGKDLAYVVSASVLMALVSAFYFVNFNLRLHYDVSEKPEDWAALGEYFGGILSPVLSFISIVLLIKSLGLQNDANASLRRELEGSEKVERTRSFEALFFGMMEAQKDLFKSFEIQIKNDVGSDHVDDGLQLRTLRGVDAVLWIEEKVERLREACRKNSIGEIESVAAVRHLIDQVDAKDQIFGLTRAFYIVVRLIVDRLSSDRGFSREERESHFLALINFTDYSHLRLVLMAVQFSDYASAVYLRQCADFEGALAGVNLSFKEY